MTKAYHLNWFSCRILPIISAWPDLLSGVLAPELQTKPLPAPTYDPAYDTATKQATTEVDLASKQVR